MVIQNSNVAMSSSRAYQRQTTRSSYDLKREENSFFIQLKETADTYEEAELYNDDNSFFTPIYNQDGIFSTDALIKKADSTNNQSVKSISETYAEVTRKLYLSILELLDLLKLRGMVSYDDFDSNGSLNLSNSSNPTKWTVSSGFKSTFVEKEFTTFESVGTVLTADGRSIDFGIELSMSREYMEEFELEYVMEYSGVFTDPLVINLDSCPVSISDQSFCFDIDCDGNEEVIAGLGSGSGFLALDINGDGKINDGSELFGPDSGNGFSDLSAYDSDGNGWIDEADEIYDKLKVWIKDKDGKDILLSLKDADVGAICLKNSKTDFSLTDDNNNVLGKVRRSGIYLHEDGTVGSLQQVDFANQQLSS